MGDETATETKEYIRDAILDTEEMKKIFVRGISLDATDEEFKAFFEEHGVVTDAVVIRKDKDKTSHFGFVTFETSEQIDELLLKKEEMKFKDKTLGMNRAVPKSNTNDGAHEKTKKLFVANLPKTGVDGEALKKYLEDRHDPKYGKIESVELIKKKDAEGNKTDENKGFGFIMVSSEDMADKMQIQHACFEFNGRKVEIKKSSPPGEGGRGGGRGGRGRGAPRGQFAGGYGGGQWDGGFGGYDYYGGGYGGGYGGYGGGYPAYGAGGYAYGGGQAPRGRGGKRYAPY